MASKLDDILELHEAADQNSVIASAMPSFSLDVLRGGTRPHRVSWGVWSLVGVLG